MLGYYIGINVLGFLAVFGWIIYGLMIYFSEDNDCQSSPDNFGWLVLMVILLFFGLFALIIIILGGLLISCIVCCLGAGKGDGVKQMIDGLTKNIYDPEQFTHTDECAICLLKFDKDS